MQLLPVVAYSQIHVPALAACNEQPATPFIYFASALVLTAAWALSSHWRASDCRGSELQEIFNKAWAFGENDGSLKYSMDSKDWKSR